MKKFILVFLTGCFFAFGPQNSSAQLESQLGILDLSANGGINPHTMMPWAAGDKYRIVFVSSTTRDGTSSNIADYNMHVDTLASQAGLGSADIDWFAVLATPTVNAVTNTMTTGADPDGAFFLVDGTTMFSDSIADFWGSSTSGGSTPRPLDLTELNAAPNPVDIRSLPGACNGGFEQYRGVLTGVDVSGNQKMDGGQDVSIGSTNTRTCGPNTEAGCVQVGIWNGDDRADKWISRGTQQDDCLGRVYAMSEVLEVQLLAPEIEVLGKGMSIADSVAPSMALGTDFGKVSTGEMVMDTFWIKNDGTDTLDISSIEINGISGSNATGAFTRSLIGAMVPVEVPNDPDSVALKVTLSPTVAGKDSVLITINNNDSDEPDFDLIIRAEGVSPEIEVLGKGMSIADSVAPSMALGTDFGQVLKGEMVMDTFWIKNDGTDTLDVSSIEINGISGSNATGAFTRSLIGAMVPVEVPNDPDSVALKVTFSPTAVGKDSVLITINNNDLDEPDFDLIIRAEGVMFMSTDTLDAGLMAVDPCSCGDPDNLTTGGGEFLFHDILTVMGPPGLDLRLLVNDMEFLDNAGNPLPVNTTMIPETGAMTGIYQVEFWHRSGVATTITYGEAGGGGLMATETSSVCLESDCAVEPIPTLSQWGIILLGLILITIGLVGIRQKSMV